jgi:hypothetical protein
MSNAFGICPVCYQQRPLTKHHVLPRRFFQKQRRPMVLFLCRPCHNKLEKLIPFRPKKKRSWYIQTTINFVKGGDYDRRSVPVL